MSTLNEQTLSALRRIADGQSLSMAAPLRSQLMSSGWVRYRVPGTREVEFELTPSGVMELKRHPLPAPRT